MINQLNEKRFMICINNEGYEASLDRWKVYQCVPDKEAERHMEIRVIDEEGEDYLYPLDCFSPIHLELSVANALVMENSVSGNL
jgi:hypothetical protein